MRLDLIGKHEAEDGLVQQDQGSLLLEELAARSCGAEEEEAR